jgi:hypothetical protein
MRVPPPHAAQLAAAEPSLERGTALDEHSFATEEPPTTPGARPREPIAALAGALALTIALAALHLWSVLRYPAPYVDEAWLIARAFAFLQTGEPFGPLDVGIFDRVPNGWRTLGVVSTALSSIGLLGAESADLFGPRSAALGFGLCLLLALFRIGSALANWRVGLLFVALTGLSSPFFYSAHLARPDIIAAAFAYTALAIHVSNARGQARWGLLAGLSLMLGFETHANALLLGAPIATLFLLDHGLGLFRQRHFWGFVAGVVIGIAAHLAHHVLPDPDAYLAIGRLSFGPVHTPPLLTMNGAIIAKAVLEMDGIVDWARPAGRLLLGAALVACVVLRDRTSIRVATVTLSLLLAFALLVRSKQQFYLIWIGPALDLLLAFFVYRVLTAALWHRVITAVARVAIVAIIAGVVYAGVPRLSHDLYAEYQRAQHNINAVTRPGDSLMGRQQYWLGLQDHVFYSWESLIHYFRTHPGATLEEAFEEHKPDLFIIDSGLGKFITDGDTGHMILDSLRLPAAQMTAFLRKRGRAVARFDSYYGPTVVFRLQWDGRAP